MSLFDLLSELVNAVFLVSDRDDSKGIERIKYYIKRTIMIVGVVLIAAGLFVVIDLTILHW